MSSELNEQQNATVGMTVGVIEVRSFCWFWKWPSVQHVSEISYVPVFLLSFSFGCFVTLENGIFLVGVPFAVNRYYNDYAMNRC